MAARPFTALLTSVLPQAPACNDVMAVDAIRSAAIEFCTNSLYWQETLDPEVLTKYDFPFDLSAPSGARVAQVMSVSVDGKPIAPAPVDALESVAGWQDLESTEVTHYYQPSPDQIVLYPKPVNPVSVVMRVAYTPKRDSSGIENYVYETRYDALVSGALSFLMLMPGQPWSNPQLGEYHRKKFLRAVSDAQIGVNKSFNRAVVMTAMNRFA